MASRTSMQIPIDYVFAGIMLLVPAVLGIAMIALPEVFTRVFRLRRGDPQRYQAYECGFTPTGTARTRFSIKFYLVAMLFILFDIEAIFLYPWLVVHPWLGWFGLIEMGVFVLILVVGYVYIWRRGAFRWE
jgi:NADH-quinone oxidoreductase subunit A